MPKNLRGLILWGFLVPHQGLPYTQSPLSKAIDQLKTFPDKYHNQYNMIMFQIQLSNKFGMLDNDEVEDTNESDDAQSPSIDG